MKKLFIRITSFLFHAIRLPERVRDLFMWPLATRILGEDYNEPLPLEAGFTVHAYLGDQLGRLALFYGRKKRYFWEPATTKLLERLLPGARHVFIAGAHIGLTVLYARKALGPSGDIHAFEPIPHLFRIAQKNFEQNKNLGRIHLTHSALGDVPGTVTMTEDRIRSRIVASAHVGKGLQTTTVPITTIDSYCMEHRIDSIDLIFLDVEGYELNALRGAERMCTHAAPRDIIYEISLPYKDNLRAAHAIEAYLRPFGYSFYIIEETYDPTHSTHGEESITLTPATETAYEEHRNIRYFNMYATLRDSDDVRGLLRVLPAVL